MYELPHHIVVGKVYSGLHDVIASGAEGGCNLDEASEKDPRMPFLAPWKQKIRRIFR